MRFNTFDEVKKWYEATTPVREKGVGTVRDIRPVDDRRYKERRIVKINDRCYALSDGWHYGDGVTNPHNHGSGYKPTREDLVRFAPIVWRRDARGTETIAVRNAGYGSNTTIARHRFLYNHMPKWITLVAGCNNGKYFLRYTQGETFFPKATALPQQVYDALKAKKNRWMRGITLTDKATALFQREGNMFTLLSEPLQEPMKRIDKDAKAPYVEAIREFREWMLLMAPMLSYDWKTGDEAQREFGTWAVDAFGGDGQAAAYRAVLLDPVHPQRVNMLHNYIRNAIGYRHDGQLYPTDYEHIAKNFTAWVNRQCGFITFITTVPR